MTASAKKRDLALYRLKEAEESLDEAQLFYGEFIDSVFAYLRESGHI